MQRFVKENRMKKFTRILAVVCLLFSVCTFNMACKPKKQEVPEDRVSIKFLGKASRESQSAWTALVDAYNNGQGVTDKVYVTARFQNNVATASNFTASANYAYNVVTVSDNQNVLQNFAIKWDRSKAPNGYLLNLQSYADKDADFNNNSINPDTLNWWRMTFNKDAKQGAEQAKHVIGAGQGLMAVPYGSTAQFNAYNKDKFAQVGINIVSVAEDDLAKFNSENKAALMPHGYAEYKTAPVAGMKASQNLLGQTVYKVFNNRIAMNWEEQRVMFKYFTKEYNSASPSTYGFVSEYWFNYGWSVGGDVMGFNGKSYDFTLTDKSANYIVVDDNVSVNGSTYNKGDIVRHEDKVNADMAALVSANKVYAIASQYDAVFEYVALQVGTDKNVDIGSKGYGVATPETSNAENNLTNGTTAMTRTSVGKMSALEEFGFVDYCPAEQYRVYEGGSTFQKDGKDGFANEYLKVIGETYDGDVYTGELKVINGTKIVGKQATASISEGLAIPACSDPDKYQAAWDFISWVATEGQTYLADAGTIAPVAKDVLFSDKYAYAQNDRNMYAVAVASSNAQRGDWGYFESGQWVTDWANIFNNRVRRGLMTISAFDSECHTAAVNALDNMYCIIRGIR